MSTRKRTSRHERNRVRPIHEPRAETRSDAMSGSSQKSAVVVRLVGDYRRPVLHRLLEARPALDFGSTCAVRAHASVEVFRQRCQPMRRYLIRLALDLDLDVVDHRPVANAH